MLAIQSVWGTYQIDGEKLFGRGSTADIVCGLGNVSRKHALLKPTDNGIMVTDQCSTNGTQVDGIELTPGWPALATVGSLLTFGGAIFRVVEVENDNVA